MLPLSDTPSHKPPKPELDRKNSFTTLKPHLPRTWLIFFVFFLQILLLLTARNFHTSTVLTTRQPLPESHAIAAVQGADTECPSGKVFVYDLPKFFNTELLDNCHELNPWGSRCDTYSNDGFGRSATKLAGVIPESLLGAWFWTDQFASEIIYHNRMLNYRCRTLDAESATAYYIPFYAGLAVGKYLWTENYTAEDRDRHCHMMLKWVHDQPYWKKSDGWDHFITMGRITWDFRRSKEEGWGSRCIYLPGFHPTSPSDVTTWQEFVRTRTRATLFCFAGATRGLIKNDFRGLLLNQCYNSSGSCRVVDCGGSKCSNGTSLILESFLGSDFCLQPRGDSFTRRSIFDCMIAGSIPVFFWNRTAYSQYEWFLPGQPESYSVFIDKKEVLNGKSIKEVLENFKEDEVRKMREKVIEYIPRIVYAKPHEGLEGMKDAFDVAVEGVLNRIKDQEQEGFKW
ncbi:putative exostosin [Helianthus annuus]|nr:putative exostosin [Helianthus annuus]